MQQLVELRCVDALHRDRVVDQSFVHHVARDAHRGRRRALARARLQQVERAAFHRELEVLHVAVVALQAILHRQQLGIGAWQALRHLVDVQRRANAGHHVFALRVHQELAVELALTGGRVARERDAGAGIFAHVAEDHRDDVDARAQVVSDAVHLAVVDGFLERPGTPDGFDRAPQLRRGIHREVGAGDTANERLVLDGQRS